MKNEVLSNYVFFQLHSEYRSTYRWHEYTPRQQQVVSRPPQPLHGAGDPGDGGDRGDDEDHLLDNDGIMMRRITISINMLRFPTVLWYI